MSDEVLCLRKSLSCECLGMDPKLKRDDQQRLLLAHVLTLDPIPRSQWDAIHVLTELERSSERTSNLRSLTDFEKARLRNMLREYQDSFFEMDPIQRRDEWHRLVDVFSHLWADGPHLDILKGLQSGLDLIDIEIDETQSDLRTLHHAVKQSFCQASPASAQALLEKTHRDTEHWARVAHHYKRRFPNWKPIGLSLLDKLTSATPVLRFQADQYQRKLAYSRWQDMHRVETDDSSQSGGCLISVLLFLIGIVVALFGDLDDNSIRDSKRQPRNNYQNWSPPHELEFDPLEWRLPFATPDRIDALNEQLKQSPDNALKKKLADTHVSAIHGERHLARGRGGGIVFVVNDRGTKLQHLDRATALYQELEAVETFSTLQRPQEMFHRGFELIEESVGPEDYEIALTAGEYLARLGFWSDNEVDALAGEMRRIREGLAAFLGLLEATGLDQEQVEKLSERCTDLLERLNARRDAQTASEDVIDESTP